MAKKKRVVGWTDPLSVKPQFDEILRQPPAKIPAYKDLVKEPALKLEVPERDNMHIVHTFKPQDTDLLTGKPRKTPRERCTCTYGPDDTQTVVPITRPKLTIKQGVLYSSVGSTQRMLTIQEHIDALNF